MKIAIITNTRPHEGGVTTYVNNIAFLFRQLGNEVDVLTVFGSSQNRNVNSKYVKYLDFVLKGAGLKAVIAYVLSGFVLLIQIIKASLRKKYDVFYAMDISAANVVIYLGQKFRQRLCLRVGGVISFDLLTQNKITKDSWAHKYFIEQELKAYRKTRKIIPNSIWSQNYIKAVVPEAKLTAPIYSPVDIRSFNKNVLSREITRKAFNIMEDDFVIIFPGRLEYRKGPHVLIEVMATLSEKNEKIKAIILGVGPEEANIKKLIKAKGLENNILMPGVISHEEMPRFYCGADCFVLPALPVGQAEEIMPNSVLEAMASELPVIVSSLGELPHFINHGKDGYLIPFGDIKEFSNQINELVCDRSKCIEIGREARSKIVKCCSQELIVKKLVEIFSEQ